MITGERDLSYASGESKSWLKSEEHLSALESLVFF
jgi:hypothetical protein